MTDETQTNAPKQPTRYALVCVLCKTESPAYSEAELISVSVSDLQRSHLLRQSLQSLLTKLGWNFDRKPCFDPLFPPFSPYCHRCTRFM